MTVTMPRGDIRTFIFTITDSSVDEKTVFELTDIYFTVKRTWNDKNYLIQKRLSNGEIEHLYDNTYQFVIEASDTDNLQFGNYVFDIELVGNGIKQTQTGELILTYEATHASNE